MADILTNILRAASKHPNSRVSKLIYSVEEEPTQKNIVLLLIELAEHAEYSTDFDVSLKYYLDLFERLGINHDLVLNEASLLLVNSSKIYSKRVDYVQSLVERQILTLSNADDELQKNKLQQQQTENAVPVEKPKKGRKRALEAPSDPYEVALASKKFKKLTAEKRFTAQKTVLKAKTISRNIEMEQHIHPAGWQHATIYDLENEEDVDTKRNYKLFTYHVEHRYNTLVPDINFRLHFKVKDYMDEQEELEETEACNTDRIWPPLSEAYVQKYLHLENYVLQRDVKANKRKAAQQEKGTQELAKRPTIVVDKEPVDEPKTNINTSIINGSIDNNSHLESEQILLDSSTANTNNLESNLLNKSLENLQSSNINDKNDSGLGQSMLDETNNTLENTQLNCTLETSITAENINESTLPEANKSLNVTDSQTGNDSALETSILDCSSNTENNTIIHENLKSLNTTTNKENLNDSNLLEASICPNVTETQPENCSALDERVNNIANNATTEVSENLKTPQESSRILDITTSKLEETKQSDIEDLIKATESRKDSALSEDHRHSISTENLAVSRENLNILEEKSGKKLKIDLVEQQDKSTTQIHVDMPNADDEGVYLSDLEEHDCCLLSPVVKATNILPGVERKNIKIVMDEELRQALEMRDGIMEHFGYETYKVPVMIENVKQKLFFNILKLPEKLLRRKAIFKLGPDMDLYLQARSLKRCRPEPIARVTRNTQLLQWFPLNNTDMTGVCITPPNSPGHTPVFYGFSDDEDDNISCVDFCGFTEMEQSEIKVKQTNRLSRDSGVGVDVHNLAQERETLEITYEEGENSAIDNCTESILNQLNAEIRDVLTTELEDYNNENISAIAAESKESATQTNSELTDAPSTSLNNTEETEKLCKPTRDENSETVSTQNCSTNNSQESSETDVPYLSSNNAEETEILCTESSIEHSASLSIEKCFSKSTQDLDVIAESSSKTQTSTEQTTIESAPFSITDTKNNDVEMSCADPSNREQSNKSAEELLKEKLDFSDAEKNVNTGSVEISESDDDVMLDLSTQGNKTKIQQWHEHLQPILAKSRERHHFDIYKLGSEIIDTIQTRRKLIEEPLIDIKSACETSNKNIASFYDIMDSKDKSYVSRYFLSTLLLANQSNIEISIDNKSSENPSSWNDINLKLLSTKRHTVAIEDNIGMIDNKQNARDKDVKIKYKEIKKQASNNYQEKDEDEPLIKLQSKKLKTSLKRSSDNVTTLCLAENKTKEITSPTKRVLPSLIESVQVIAPPFATAPLVTNTSIMPSTSRQAQNTNNPFFDVNINAIRMLQPIEKVQKRNDDYDSGIFSIDEMSTS